MYFEYENELKQNPEYNEMLASMRSDVDVFMKHFKDDSRFISGWGHGYFCNEDGGRLIYDIKKPFEHSCSICGKVYKEYQYNACYITMLRNEAAVTVIKAALLSRISEKEAYIQIVKKMIDFYADRYEAFTVHAKDKINCSPSEDVGGAGKIMPQGLNEAIIIIRFINALELIKDDLEEEWLASLKSRLFDPVFDLLLPQKMHIHNIPTWINSAIGVMGLFFDDKRWIEEATKNPFNLFEQLEQGVTESGFWYEGSIHYNFFALEGVMNFFVFARDYQFPVDETYTLILQHMFDAAYKYSFDNDIFPNPSDGWPNVGLKTYSYVYYMAYKVLGSSIIKYLKHIESNPLPRIRLPLSEPYYYENKIPLERILFAPGLSELESEPICPKTSQNFAGSNCAILRNEVFNLFFKYGHQTKSHAHPDKMNIEIMVNGKVLTKDLSNSGYASKMCNQWHRKIAAHNTCVINGVPTDLSNGGVILDYSETNVKASAKVYPDTTYIRALSLNGNCMDDIFEVQSEKEGVIDWFFHFETAIQREGLQLSAHCPLEEYPFIQELQELTVADQGIRLDHELALVDLELEAGMKVYLAKTYNNPADQMRDTILVRKIGKQATFKTKITAK